MNRTLGIPTLALIAAAAMALAAQTAWAQQELLDESDASRRSDAAAANVFQFQFYWENDFEGLKLIDTNDRHFTNGIGISVTGDPDWAEDVAIVLPFGEHFANNATGEVRYAVGAAISQLMFTPENILVSAPQPFDHPWGGYLYGSAFVQRADQRTLDHLQIDLGIVGPSSLAEESQIWIHENFDENRIPTGWGNQLKDEPAVQLTAKRKWRFDLTPDASSNGGWGVQAIPTLGAALGTVYRHVEGGGMLRLGFNLPDDFGPSRLQDFATSEGTPSHGWTGYLFARLTGKAVEHDIFINGSDYRSGPGRDLKNLVGEGQLGIVMRYAGENWNVDLGYSQTYLTEQFDGQDGPGKFGAVTLRFDYRF